MKYFINLNLILIFLSSCGDENNTKIQKSETFREVSDIQKPKPIEDKMLVYPYRADKKRLSQINLGIRKIKIGMEKHDVIAIMGEPDEIRESVAKENLNKVIGHSFIYIKKRDKKKGSFNEKNEHLVGVAMDDKDKVVNIFFIP